MPTREFRLLVAEKKRQAIFHQLRSRLVGLIFWYGVGFLLVQPLLFNYWSADVESLPIIHLHPIWSPLVIGGLGFMLLILQALHSHESFHHAEFQTQPGITTTRLSLIPLAFILAFTLLIPAVVPEARPTLLPAPYSTTFTAFSALAIALNVEYLSKIGWDYSKKEELPSRKIILSTVALVSIMVLGVFPIVGSIFTFPQRLAVVVTSICTGLVLWIWFSHHYELWRLRASIDYDTEHNPSQLYQWFQRSRPVSSFAGVLAGIGLPLSRGTRDILNGPITPETVTVGTSLLAGYWGLVIYLIAALFATIAILVTLSVLAGVHVAAGWVSSRS